MPPIRFATTIWALMSQQKRRSMGRRPRQAQKPGAAREAPLCAREGDRLVIRGHRIGEPLRDGEIIEVLGDDGAPPYVVRWADDGRVTRVYPGLDAYVDPLGIPARQAR